MRNIGLYRGVFYIIIYAWVGEDYENQQHACEAYGKDKSYGGIAERDVKRLVVIQAGLTLC